jgi:hypothetical protein
MPPAPLWICRRRQIAPPENQIQVPKCSGAGQLKQIQCIIRRCYGTFSLTICSSWILVTCSLLMTVEQMQGATCSAHRCCLFRRYSAKLFHFRTLVVRAVSVSDRPYCCDDAGGGDKRLTDRRFMCLWQGNTIT